MSTVTELAAEIQQLSAADKHLLMQLLLTDRDEAEPDAEEAYRAEIVRRVKAIRNGEAAIRALQDWQE
ncbi:addiction module protein [Massilia norwichensis]|uniref:Addiction module protein n=1 Tax=Massilia norwichensis TaxID=1442366 RepID=A0ABT2A4H9_9BURK|nr:addiction module protein [Massilia norwichensis]MCS0589094.1 addiction module protein [Massilia norwichensis]